jgi:hypothetical protein
MFSELAHQLLRFHVTPKFLEISNVLKAMSTAKRRRGESLHLELPNGMPAELPPLAALFLVLFDVKAG